MSLPSLRTTDGLTLHHVIWQPQTEPKAVILLIHGIGEHSGRYEHVGQFFNRRGYAVVSYDHRGHGKSEGERTYFTSFDVPVEDMRMVFKAVQSAFHNKPIFIYGHSMGSLISTLYLLKYQDGVQGYVSSGSPLGLDTTAPPLLVFIGKIIARFFPKLRLIPGDLKTLSRDPEVIKLFEADLLTDKGSTRAGMAAAFLHHALSTPTELRKITLPILIVHGDADKLTPLEGSKRINQYVGSTDKTFKIYPGLYHELHNEPEKEQVLGDIAAWMDARV
jgi:alpha-beta hydrolase superfamily lysophospholipase